MRNFMNAIGHATMINLEVQEESSCHSSVRIYKLNKRWLSKVWLVYTLFTTGTNLKYA
jgi:hypothetical protein